MNIPLIDYKLMKAKGVKVTISSDVGVIESKKDHGLLKAMILFVSMSYKICS
jgi:imidazolonepropionase-like amidohydrolase